PRQVFQAVHRNLCTISQAQRTKEARCELGGIDSLEGVMEQREKTNLLSTNCISRLRPPLRASIVCIIQVPPTAKKPCAYAFPRAGILPKSPMPTVPDVSAIRASVFLPMRGRSVICLLLTTCPKEEVLISSSVVSASTFTDSLACPISS